MARVNYLLHPIPAPPRCRMVTMPLTCFLNNTGWIPKLLIRAFDKCNAFSTAHDGANADPHKSYSGLRHAFRTIVSESGWKGLYQVGTNVLSTISWHQLPSILSRSIALIFVVFYRELFQTSGELVSPGDCISLGLYAYWTETNTAVT